MWRKPVANPVAAASGDPYRVALDEVGHTAVDVADPGRWVPVDAEVVDVGPAADVDIGGVDELLHEAAAIVSNPSPATTRRCRFFTTP
jgi:hypothetical protein